ncbi:MAG: RNA-binding protein [Bacteroidales bacterium]
MEKIEITFFIFFSKLMSSKKKEYLCRIILNLYFYMNIFIGSLPYSVKDSDLEKIFEVYGEVTSAKVISDKFSGRSKGFGFVEMSDDEAAQKAIDALNNSEIGGRAIVVNKANDRSESPRRERDNGYNRRY